MQHTLETLAAIFKAMNGDEQLMLLDYLGELTHGDICDELATGLHNAAYALARETMADDEPARDFADATIPMGLSGLAWKAHQAKRDATIANRFAQIEREKIADAAIAERRAA